MLIFAPMIFFFYCKRVYYCIHNSQGGSRQEYIDGQVVDSLFLIPWKVKQWPLIEDHTNLKILGTNSLLASDQYDENCYWRPEVQEERLKNI